MHRDTKLGLALGMLVIGFAAAFCFPRQHPSPETGKTSSSEVAQLEPEIELVPVRAYRQPLPSSPPLQSILNEQPETVEQTVVPAAQVFPGRAQRPGETVLSGLPDPTGEGRREGRTEEPRDRAIHTGDALHPSLSPSRSPTVPRTYAVESGDTLSGIALRFFGSSARFQEIFEANRDKLSSPDALKLGMVLTIPEPGTNEERGDGATEGRRNGEMNGPHVPPTLSPSHSDSQARSTAGTEEAPASRFQHVGTAPFVTTPSTRVSQQESDSQQAR